MCLLHFTETEATSVVDTLVYVLGRVQTVETEKKRIKKKKKNYRVHYSQHCSLWVEWIHGVDLIEDCAGVHKDLPDMVVVSPANLDKFKYNPKKKKNIF